MAEVEPFQAASAFGRTSTCTTFLITTGTAGLGLGCKETHSTGSAIGLVDAAVANP